MVKPVRFTGAPKYALGPDVDLDTEPIHTKDGKRLTAKQADRITREVLTQAGRRGRRSLTGKAAKSPQVTVRVTPQMKVALERLAKKRGLKPAVIAREALEQYLAG